MDGVSRCKCRWAFIFFEVPNGREPTLSAVAPEGDPTVRPGFSFSPSSESEERSPTSESSSTSYNSQTNLDKSFNRGLTFKLGFGDG
jgi:hypothetical protein